MTSRTPARRTAEGYSKATDVAAELGVSVRWLQQRCQDGTFDHCRLPGAYNRRYRFTREQIDAIKAQMNQPRSESPRLTARAS